MCEYLMERGGGGGGTLITNKTTFKLFLAIKRRKDFKVYNVMLELTSTSYFRDKNSLYLVSALLPICSRPILSRPCFFL